MNPLDQLIEEFKSILIAEKYKLYIDEQLDMLNQRLNKLIDIIDAKAEDLEPEESTTIKSLFNKALVNEQEQHEIARQEYLLSALKYKECKESIALLLFEKEIVDKKVIKKIEVEAKLNMAIDSDTSLIHENHRMIKKRIFEINETIRDLINYKRELYEAKIVASKVSELLDKMANILAKAKEYDKWGEFYHKKMEAKAKEAAFMDHALQVSHQASQQMKFLKKELDDIFQFTPTSNMTTLNELLDFQDGFHGSMITDWVIENNVLVSINRVTMAQKFIMRLMASIKAYEDKSNSKMKQLKESKEYMIKNS